MVDFAVMGLNREKPPILNEESVRVLADQIHKAFSTIGFVYLTNHGISEKEVGNHKMVCICLVKNNCNKTPKGVSVRCVGY